MQNYKCQGPGHGLEYGRTICLDTQCKKNRVSCKICSVEHNNHLHKLVDLEYILNYLKTQSEQPDDVKLVQLCQIKEEIVTRLEEIQKFINEQIERLRSQSLKQICKGLVNNYQIVQGQEGDWNQLAQDMLKDFEVKNGQIIRETILVSQQSQNYQNFLNQFSQKINSIQNKIDLLNTILEQKNIELKNINFENFTQKYVLVGHTDMVLGIDVCKQRDLLASTSRDKTMRLWDLNNNQLLKTYSYSGWVYDVVFSKEGNLLAFSGDGDCSVKLIDISNLKNDYIICSLKGHTDIVNKLLFSNDSKYLISGSEDLSIRIWDIIKQKESFQFNLQNNVHGVAINSDDTLLASISFIEGQVNIWNFQNHKHLCSKIAHYYSGSGIEFSRNQKMLLSSGFADGMINLWNLNQLNQRRLLLIRKFYLGLSIIWPVLFSPCSRFIIFICKNQSEIKVLDSQNGELVKLFKSNAKDEWYIQSINRSPVQVAISKDMELIAYGEDNNIAVWRLK